MNPPCRCCGSSRTALVGSIIPAATFAGRLLQEPLPGGSLWVCADCDLRFRYPVLGKEALDAMYRIGSIQCWQGDIARRSDWQYASAFLQKQSSIESILDVGCFDGRFLASLGDKYEKLGIEINPEAARFAETHGVHLVGHDLTMLLSNDAKADAVTAMDVIEHTENPLEFLAGMCCAAKPGGFLLIATGNTSAWSWRLMGSRYWYCTIGEHLSFISPAWCNFAAQHLNLRLIEMKLFSHMGSNVSTWIRFEQTAKNLFYKALPSLSATIRKFRIKNNILGQSPELMLTPPIWDSATDHLFVVFRKLC